MVITDSKELSGPLSAIVRSALTSADAAALVESVCRVDVPTRTLNIGQHVVSLTEAKRIRVVGAGKASGKMAAGLEKAIGTQVRQLAIEFSGQVNVPDDRVIDCGEVKVVGCRAAGYNFPTEKVVRQTEVITSIVKDLRAGDVCLTLISGGGSALLELPKVPLEDLVAVSKALSHSGADIGCLNTVRQCLSEVKAGGLARMKPSGALIPMIGLIISDVIGDNLAMVSSGPTVMDAPRKNEVAAEILHRYLDQDQIPQSVTTILQQTPISKSKQSAVDNVLVGNNQTAIDAAIATARQAGFEIACPDRAGIDACANVVDIGRQYAQYVASCLRDRKPTALITGGEPTVQLSNSPGTGGRNLQLTAVVLEELLQSGVAPEQIQFASVGTDGEDGSAPVAGGWFDQALITRLSSDTQLRTELQCSISTNDCFRFFNSVGYCVKPFADVQTNVCDLQIMLLGSEGGPVINNG